ncbi:hypothetical protein MPL3365_70057 [Mesorhizobium plurifarium]|uniref:Uncharacterized protein n=1 Tax=Mesorhizobium plurifarium TaxID=69974 RepID=A0A090GGT6_MESPL|nr:hypothetical protein MPL3365_70057 [Mesorhizobium plurifarium]
MSLPPSGGGDFFRGVLAPQCLPPGFTGWSTASLAGLFQRQALGPHFDPNRPIGGQDYCGSGLHGFLTEAGKTGSKAGGKSIFTVAKTVEKLFFRMDRRQIGDWWRDWLTIFVHLLNQSATDA